MTPPVPFNVEEILGLLGRTTNEPVTVTPLNGGYRNATHRIEGKGFDWVVKQYAGPDDNPLFPLRFDDEWRLLADYEESAIAPRLVATDRQRRLLVYSFVPGEIWGDDLNAAGSLLSRVAALPVQPWLRPLPGTIDELRSHTEQILGEVSAPPVGLLDVFDVTDQTFEPRLVHTDCGPGNLIGELGRYTLIDWQCPGQGDPVEDLAAFTSPGVQILYGRAPLSSTDIEIFLGGYGSGPAVERFRWKAKAYSARFTAYCAWRVERLSEGADRQRYREALAAELELISS